MKKIVTLIVAICFANIITAQISEGGNPYSFTHTLKSVVASKSLAPVSEEWKERESENSLNNGTLELVAQNIVTNFNMNNSGTWEILKNGDRVWRLKITAQKAIGLNPLFKDFYLPIGAKLFVYSQDKKQVLGAFTDYNNDESKVFSTQIVFGQTMVLEYLEPREQANKGFFTIEKVGSFFKNATNYKSADDFGDSDPCQVNINCSPEGDDWQDEKKGVARILVSSTQGQGWCTGSLVNNTNLDCKPYFLTAYHCGNNSNANHFNQWIFYFDYEFSGCSSSSEPDVSNTTMSGASVKARANDLTSTSTSSDFLLLELNQVVPQNYDVYYNGWNLQSSGPSSGVAIHHPAGDVKKISTYATQPTTLGVSWLGLGYSIISGQTHWNVSWASTANGFGVSEGGSSGSPIFNDSGYVIGTLSGGGSSCSSTGSQDQYGKMSFHWESNSSSQTRQLKPWLDPTNSGLTILEGTYSPCTAATTNDAALVEIIKPKGDLCDNSFAPQIILRNNGAVLLSSATISYQLNSEIPVNLNWTGSLTRGDSETIDLTAGTSSLSVNTFTVIVSNPNGIADDNSSNNLLTSNFNTNVRKGLPFIERFETSTFPSLSWFVANPDNDRTWEEVPDFGSFGTSSKCMYIDNWDYEANGEYDWFVSDAYDLSDTLDDLLHFDLAYTYYQQLNGSNISYDSLGIGYSLDCGESFYWLWKEGGESLATLKGGVGEEFIPQTNEWESIAISLGSAIKGQPSVVFAFIAENGYGNNLYIDNIGVGNTLLSIDDQNILLNEVELFPNPSTNLINLNITLENSAFIRYVIYNTIGQSLYSNSAKTAELKETIDISKYSTGMYYVKIEAAGEQKIIKFIRD